MVLSTVIALAGLGLTGGHTQVASAATPSCIENPDEAASVNGDINGDAGADVVVGVPNAFMFGHTDVGEVDVFLTDGSRQRVSLETITGSGGEQGGARFGASASTPDFDHNQCADLAVGSPGLDGKGAVYLLHGSRSGVTSAGGVKISAPDGVAGDQFGAAVVSSARQDGSTDLWVGAPGRKVSGLAAAGEVYHYRVSDAFAPTLVGTLSYATAGVAGTPAAGDRFGSVLSVAFAQVAVGVPRRAVNGHAQAGEVVFASQPSLAVKAQVFSQDTTGVPGVAEKGDHFGAALAQSYVGVPGEDIGSVRDAGAVQLFGYTPDHFIPRLSYSEDSSGIPGKAEAGDQFGAALATGTWILCQEEGDLAIGAPGESLGRVAGAGSVTVIGVRSEGTPCAAKTYTQGGGLPGQPAAGNRVGATLTTLSGNADDDEDYRSGLVIGSPGQDGAAANAGRVLTGLASNDLSLGAIGGDQHDLSFGSVLATTIG